MLIIISPAKTMNMGSNYSDSFAICHKTKILLNELKTKTSAELEKILNVSKKLAEINFDRVQNFDSLPVKKAFYAYDGDVYKNINRENLSITEQDYVTKNLKIISGFYGLLNAFDQIKPYRLEMNSKLPGIASKGMDLYWQDDITEKIAHELSMHSEKVLLNLASNEYSDAINRKKIIYPIIDVFFLEERNGKLQNIAINSKRARGMLANYFIKNQINNPIIAQKFAENGYQFSYDLSSDNSYYFVRYNY